MEFRDERIIYLIPPKEILLDVKRALNKSKLEIKEIKIRKNGWDIYASNNDSYANVKITYEKKRFYPFETFGEIYINKLSTIAEGDEDFVKKIKWNLEISLLRCLP